MSGNVSKNGHNQNKPALEPLDREIADALTDRGPSSGPASILIVSREGMTCERLVEMLEEQDHRCICIGRLDTAKATIARGRFDLVLVDPDLPDGDGFELVRMMQKTASPSKAIVITDQETFTYALTAMRCGAVDFIRFPINMSELVTTVNAALIKSRTERQREERLAHLKKICEELNNVRHQISDQVDVLCKDLVDVYEDMTEQMHEVALTSEYKTLLKQELDVEELLRTSLQFLLTKTGPTNAAVFLPDADHQFGLGAYVNYDCPRESISVLLDHLCNYICPQMSSEKEIISFDDVEQFADWIDSDVEFLEDSQVIAYACHHEGECLAVIVMFRSKTDPFAEELAGTLDAMRGIFAEQLSNIIKIHHRARPSWPSEAIDDENDFEGDDYGFGFEGGLAA